MINKFDGEYAFLSNFYPSEVQFEGGTFPTVEHAFQAAKTLDEDERLQVVTCDTPGLAKREGRHVTLRRDWEQIKYSIMEELVRKKFQIPELKEKLIATGDEELEEGTWWHDNTWGNCYCDRCKNIVGQNHLGKILMKIREENK